MAKNKNKVKNVMPMQKGSAEYQRAMSVIKEATRFENDSVENDSSDPMTSALGLPNNPWSAQLSQPTTMFKNLRFFFISNLRQLLSQMYCEIGIVQTIVDLPVDDAYRGGLDIKSKELDENDIAKLVLSMEENDDIAIAAQTSKWNRLFGGGGTIILTDQDPATELKIESIKEGDFLQFKDADMWELFFSEQNLEGDGQMLPDAAVQYFDYYGIKLHRSRVMTRTGIRAPSFLRPRLRGWGLSCLEGMVRSINQYLKTSDLAFEVMDEFKIDIFKIKNFANTLMQKGGKEQILTRVQIANMEKNYNNAITMDAEDDYQNKELSFTGLAETMGQNRLQVAADVRMPQAKLFGTSAAGFNSGEDDIENYNAIVEQIRSKDKMHIYKMVKLRCQQEFGFVPEDLWIGFKPLRILSSEQEENVKTQKFNRVQTARQGGEIDSKEYRQSINHDNLLPVKLEENKEVMDLGEGDTSAGSDPVGVDKSKLSPKDIKDKKEKEPKS